MSESRDNELFEKTKGWIVDSVAVIEDAYGWVEDSSDSLYVKIIDDENLNMGAFVNRSQNPSTRIYDVESLTINAHFYEEGSDLVKDSEEGLYWDQVIAHEMVHVLEGQNTIRKTNDNGWFTEGLALMLTEGDKRVLNQLGTQPSDEDFYELVGELMPDSGADSRTMRFYAACYLGVRFLDYEIKQAGIMEGVKHLTRWLRQKKIDLDGLELGTDQQYGDLSHYIRYHLSNRNYQDELGFLKRFIQD